MTLDFSFQSVFKIVFIFKKYMIFVFDIGQWSLTGQSKLIFLEMNVKKMIK